MQDIGGVFLAAFISIAIWIGFIIGGPFLFTWAVNTVANADFLVIDSFWDWFILALVFAIIRMGASSSSEN